MSRKVTAPSLSVMKAKGAKIVALTAYDWTSARLCDGAGVDIVLVGDSLGNVIHGLPTTIGVTMSDVLYHLRIVRRGVERALVVADFPFGASQVSPEKTLENAILFLQAGAEAVKLEGDYPEQVEVLVKAGIPVIGHLGFTPQSVHQFGGFKVQGKGSQGKLLQEQAKRLENAGASAIVLELIPASVALELSGELRIPTIGIGAGPGCDGQIQVFHDVLGLSLPTHKHSFAFADGFTTFGKALEAYSGQVRGGTFPTDEQSF